MELKQAPLQTCGTATGMVVVIDVLRAFTTTAHAFAAGAHEIMLVGTVEEALALRRRMPGALVMGKIDGTPVEGFNFAMPVERKDGLLTMKPIKVAEHGLV